MASSHKKRTGLRAALIVLLCLVLVCAVAAAVLYSFVSRKIKAFQSGASFALDYTITSTEAEPMPFTPCWTSSAAPPAVGPASTPPERCSWRCTRRAPAPSTMPL